MSAYQNFNGEKEKKKKKKKRIIIITCGATELSRFKQTVLSGPIITAEVLGLIFSDGPSLI